VTCTIFDSAAIWLSHKQFDGNIADIGYVGSEKNLGTEAARFFTGRHRSDAQSAVSPKAA